MSVLFIVTNIYNDYNYSELLNEITDELVVLSKYPLKDKDKFMYYEKIPSDQSSSYIELRAIELYEKYKFKYIIAEDEFDLIMAGRLRDRFGIPGQTEESATAFRNKVVMKNYLSNTVKVPKYRPLSTMSDLIDFINEHGYPVIVKPVDHAASLNLRIIKDRNDLLEFTKLQWQPNLLVEEFIEGDMYHIDAVVDQNKTIVFSASKYFSGCLAFMEKKSTGSYQIDPKDPMYNRLKDFFEKVISALPTPEVSAYHLEVFHTKDDEIVFCEIASRIGGGYILDNLLDSFSFNMCEYWIRRQCNLPVNMNYTTEPASFNGFVIIPPRKGVLLDFPKSLEFDWVKRYEHNCEINKKYNDPSTSIDELAGIVVTDQTSQGVLDKLYFIDDWYRNQLEWEPID